MKAEGKKDFDKEAAAWDSNPGRVKLANDVAAAIIREVRLDASMDALDFGCGTGLVTLQLQPRVRTITGADSSAGMLGMINEKVRAQGIGNVRTQQVDFEQGGRVQGRFHVIVSSMTLHHVPDIAGLFGQWYGLLHDEGTVCCADLDAEDGSFHGDNTGVFHLGFDRAKLKQLLQEAGFRDVRDSTAATMVKDIEGKGKREFSIFLLTAKR